MSGDSEIDKDPWERPEGSWGFGNPDRHPQRRADSNVPGFERWLQIGLESHFLDQLPMEEAFPELTPILSRSHSLSSVLKEYIDRQDSVRRADFRQALANLLASPALEPQPQNIPLFEMILQIAVALKANEIFNPLILRIREGFWARLTTEQGDTLFTEAILAVSQIVSPRQDALACLNGLIDSIPFQKEPYPHTLSALVALCRCEPGSFPQHFERLRSKLEVQVQHFKPEFDNLRRVAATLISLVGPSRFLEDLITIRERLIRERLLPVMHSQDFWLLQAVFSPSGNLRPLIECRNAATKNEIKFHLAGDQVPLHFSITEPLGWSNLKDVLIDRNWVIQAPLPRGGSPEAHDFFSEHEQLAA